jgi:antitoxin MazE
MVKTLNTIGNSLGLILEKPILELLNITPDTPLEITTDGVGIFIRPIGKGHAARVRAAAQVNKKIHDRAFRKLAE